MKKYLMILCLLLVPTKSFCQKDTIQKEILNFGDSKSELIAKGRGLLMEKFITNDFKKVKEIKDYLLSAVVNNDYVVFYPAEYILITYFTQDYDEILESITRYSSFVDEASERRIKPQDDLLLDKILSKSRQSRVFLYRSIDSADLNDSDKEFLIINLESILSVNSDQFQPWLNILADNYLENYPDSRYNDYIRKYVRYEITPSNYGIGVEFLSGLGCFTNDLENIYKNNLNLGVAFDFYYRKFAVYLRTNSGICRTKRDITYSNGVWAKNSPVQISLFDAHIGFPIAENNYLKLSPVIGIGAAEIGPPQGKVDENPDLNQVTLKFSTIYSLGMNLEINLKRVYYDSGEWFGHGPEQFNLFLRLRYTYNHMQFDRKYNGYSGDMHFLTIGFGFTGYKLIQKY